MAKRLKTTTIVIHHTVTPQLWDEAKTMANIKDSHEGISPYHRVIGYNWQWSDQGQGDVKPHAGNYPVNLESIAVSLVGNFTVDELKDYQSKKLAATLKEWISKYNIKRANIKLHREVRLKPTACPGKIDQEFINILLEEPMNCELEKEEIRKLNTEIGIVTKERDENKNALIVEKKGHSETLDKLTDTQAEVELLRQKVKDLQLGNDPKFKEIRVLADKIKEVTG